MNLDEETCLNSSLLERPTTVNGNAQDALLKGGKDRAGNDEKTRVQFWGALVSQMGGPGGP